MTFVKYKKKCIRCRNFFDVEKSMPSTREYCNTCKSLLTGKKNVLYATVSSLPRA